MNSMMAPNKEIQQKTNDLNEGNVLIFAIKHYDRPCYVTSEFEEDFKRIQYIQKLLFRYEKKGELKERLILNHITVLYNVFGAEAVSRILFLRIAEQHRSALKTFLVYLNIMPDVIESINGTDIRSSSIPLDGRIVQTLRKL